MKVLMFGWEFPPHISGGLGTACAGLTDALTKEQVDVLFAVPKLHGGEHALHSSLINASIVPIRQKKTVSEKVPRVKTVMRQSDSKAPAKEKKFASGLKTLEVDSLLTPYQTEIGQTPSLVQWNYAPGEGSPLSAAPETAAQAFAPSRVRYTKQPYPFSGKYGANLMEEVDRYAQAGAEIARRNSFDLIHAHDWMTYRAGIAARAISGKPLVVHVHATEIDRSGAHVNPKVFEIEKEGMTSADRVVAVSQWTKDIAVQHYKLDPDKIEVVHNGISARAKNSAHAHGALFGASKIVTFLGRITHQKGPGYFIEAARRVHEHFPDAHFVVAGSGDQLPQIIERVAQVRLSRYFHFTGFLRGEDIDRIWSMSDVYVMPSVSEPFGIAPLEAIQAGVPVIISKQAGVAEVMPHAIKVDFWNSDALAESICNVLRFRSLANTLRTNGSEEITNITWTKSAKKLKLLYNELCSKKRTAKPGTLLSGAPTRQTADTAVL